MSRSRAFRPAWVLAMALVWVALLPSCTPSRYGGAAGTVAIAARRLGIALSSTAVTCQPVPNDIFMHKCTAPIGAGGAKVVLDVRVSSVVTATVKTEAVVVTIPASLARGSLRRNEAGYKYVTQCGWRADARGKWVVDPAIPPRTFLVDQHGALIKEV